MAETNPDDWDAKPTRDWWYLRRVFTLALGVPALIWVLVALSWWLDGPR